MISNSYVLFFFKWKTYNIDLFHMFLVLTKREGVSLEFSAIGLDCGAFKNFSEESFSDDDFFFFASFQPNCIFNGYLRLRNLMTLFTAMNFSFLTEQIYFFL